MNNNSTLPTILPPQKCPPQICPPQKCPPQKCPNNIFNNILTVVHLLIMFYAVYLNFRCNHGFNFGTFLVAIFLPEFYILWVIVVEKFCITLPVTP